MSLEKEIIERRSEIRTDDLSMSIGEWQSLYENKEIDIHPEFQRFYRWSPNQKSNLIESILLGIPIPPIFVSQRKDGIWDVVDGLQRLSTLYEFFGILKDENGSIKPPLILEKTKYLPSLEGKKWNDPEDLQNSFGQEQRLLIKRSKLSVSIILRESDDKAKFELFQRLNTGGSDLTPQEVRNCILVMINKESFLWLKSLADYQNFQEAISLSDKNNNEQYDIELALRFLIFSTLEMADFDRSKDVGQFITERMINLFSEGFDQQAAENRFKSTFDHIIESVGENSFRRYTNSTYKGGFLLTPYEVISYGLGFNYPNFPSAEETRQRAQNLFTNATYQQWSGSGIRANSRLPHLLPLGRELFAGNEN
ncbi:GmrSD restriction endonuclease domain-containing protein [Arthrospiribacter ruber]|uniref:DUF262 domain-containing protein n=1 Tax=Arthrospiribacter ruber TaxID=2487934 RepID=A0A951M5V0_9BACT|nr:DUF262 domain-containing protein [Arthrospiribacter ruber]MBW3466226.1 DUF262 domain-containing protein [Arthrospiribacter ruber]